MFKDQQKIINLALLRNQFATTKYCDLIMHHLAKRATWKEGYCEAAIEGTVELLPKSVQTSSRALVDGLVREILLENIKTIETNNVLDQTSVATKSFFKQHNLTATDEDIFNIFSVVTMSIVEHIVLDEEFRHSFMPATRIWGSLALLYPILAFIFFPAPIAIRIAYTIAQLGYVLLGLGFFKLGAGFLKVFGIKTRKSELITGAILLIFGTILLNLLKWE